ncbi:related to Biogenesis of lysosome-related organelles complex 1 subunit CNL1 [Saccharomycodes ludwigii]|uniref:Biogenesis of lysosome-related organelles complex 1 subunit CNL1 n=1 Tax=Saccharomycodes ludwigii TaxID=36035 RepID=A0A376B780_9ASCO|nr:hypothetical protein SCDLUD_003195 [Saccharomycodes ludwigii]KAH3900224.1 hypothetical protein SCDLUD_003195 [Saccharomycodes ludwigii]SSD60556.1 related to Biogenesis of lysosome-related organelles complex 1 subunit CNL1 [Saccharomycodes ludwigii]
MSDDTNRLPQDQEQTVINENIDDQDQNGDSLDPLDINKLSLDYDYLMYKISDYISAIHQQTTDIVRQQSDLITKGIINTQIDQTIENCKGVLSKCHDLEDACDMLENIDSIIDEFFIRLRNIIQKLPK